MGWILFLIVIVAAIFIAWLHPDAISERDYKALLASRGPVNDEQLFDQYFATGELAPDIPGRVRRTIAKRMSYPAEQMLPDDDLDFYWREIDGIDLVRDLEAEFGIQISQADVNAEQAECNIRSVSNLVQRTFAKIRLNHSAGGASMQ